MMKLVFCCRRRPELTREQFQDYWLNRHGPLVRSLRERIPTMKRYVQSHTVADDQNDRIRATRGTAEPYDGITEVWFDDLDAAGPSTAEAADAGRRLLEDESTFIDFATSSVFLTIEHEIF